MRIAVVDDERPARSELVYLIRQCSPDAEIVEAESGEKLLELFESDMFDICFIDIDLKGANGTTLASMIKSKSEEVSIIFATAYQEYAVKAFELGAVDYLLKPFDLERVRKTIDRVRNRTYSSTGKGTGAIDKVMVNKGTSFQVVDVKDIIYIETEKRSCKIHTKDHSYIQNESLNYYESRLKEKRFFRIHKSYLINLDYVSEMIPTYNNGYAVKMKYSKTEGLPIGRTQMREFRQMFVR